MPRFFVPGIPQPGGSKRGFIHRHTGRVVVVEDAKRNKDWRTSVMQVAGEMLAGHGQLTGPVRLDVTFIMPRPKGHFGRGRKAGVLKATAPTYHTVKPDRTKLLRSTEDALTQCGMCWRDDTQIVTGQVTKIYGEQPGAVIQFEAAETPNLF